MIEENFKNEKNETNYAASKSFSKMGAYCPTSCCHPCTTITIARVSSSQ
jgi:hypothetical protein